MVGFMKKSRSLIAAALVAALVSGCAAPDVRETEAKPSETFVTETSVETGQTSLPGEFVQEDAGITVRLETDKTEYASGEDVNFSLSVSNAREGYTITQTFIDYTCSGGIGLGDNDLPAKMLSISEGESRSIEGSFTGGGRAMPSVTAHTITGVESLIVRPYIKINYDGGEAMVRMIVTMNLVRKKVEIPGEYKLSSRTVSCHDPSIFKDKDGRYYVFGTHMGLAVSDDLLNWQDMTAQFRAGFTQETKDKIREWNLDETSDSWYGYLWAPDVIYNEKMGKYCMYLSANGDNWVSNIVLLTADTVTGPYSYEGTVVYGGFDKNSFEKTDAPKVLKTDSIPDRYIKNGIANRKWGDEYPNCIDPCVFFDGDGVLRMSYGSWSGGIFLLTLDDETGMRDYSVQYATDAHSDAYFGTKIAGGKYVSGEGSYIERIGDWYYLFVSYGNLEATGGYNVRIFRSEKVDGPYLDMEGNKALYDTYIFNYNQSVGVRLFGGYRWPFFTNGQVAQGHNSVLTDGDGRVYMVFHTRTTNGTEGHYVKVHELFVTDDGWLVAAPYQTNASTGSVEAKDVAGDYDILIHRLDIDYKKLGVNTPVSVKLNADGTVSGALNGTWSADGDEMSVVIGGVTYRGRIFTQFIEGSTLETVVFSLLGDDQITVWGSKKF